MAIPNKPKDVMPQEGIRNGVRATLDQDSDKATMRIRAAILAGSLGILFALLIAWRVIVSWTEPPGLANRVSILQTKFEEPEFQTDSSVDDLLALTDSEIAALIERFPMSAAAYNIKADRYYASSETDASQEAWQKAVELDPRNAEGLLGLTLLAFERGDYERAIAIGEELERLDSGNPRVPLILADSLLHNGQAEKAVLVLEQHIAEDQTSVQAWELLASAHLNLRQFDKAIALYEKSLQYADSRDAHYGLAQAYARVGRREDAKVHQQLFSEMAAADSNETSAESKVFRDRNFAAHVAAQMYADASLIFREQGDLATAQEWLLRALSLQPDVLPWLEELQRVLVLRGLRWEAIDVGERLSELDSDNVETWLNLGQLYAEVENPEPAVEAYRKAIAIAPNDERCKRAQSIIRRMRET